MEALIMKKLLIFLVLAGSGLIFAADETGVCNAAQIFDFSVFASYTVADANPGWNERENFLAFKEESLTNARFSSRLADLYNSQIAPCMHNLAVVEFLYYNFVPKSVAGRVWGTRAVPADYADLLNKSADDKAAYVRQFFLNS
jgi:hypothetical protein